MRQPTSYRPDIDGLRALAVLGVVFYHAFPEFMRSGFVGVDVFFVISGYLISNIVLTGIDEGTFSFAEFYSRRIRRIFPALIVVMAACGAFGWFALFPDEYAMLGKHMGAGAAFVANIVFWSEVGYWDPAATAKPLLHLWSLGIEEQFYIFWPVLLMVAARFRAGIFALTLAILVASFSINIFWSQGAASSAFYLLPSRAWELLVGAGLAYLSRSRRIDLSANVSHALSLAGTALILVACLAIPKNAVFPGWWALLPTLGAAFVIAAGPHALANRLVLSNPAMVWVGLISYPLYLWHWPLLSFNHIVESGALSAPRRAALVVIAVLLAWATYRFIEKPVRVLQFRRWKVGALASLMTVFAVGGVVLFQAKGMPQRSTIVQYAQFQKSLELVQDPASAAACKKRYGFAAEEEFCMMHDASREPTVALIGDSHAFHVAFGLTRFYAERGENLILLGTRLPFWGIANAADPYQSATPKMLDLALSTKTIKTVIISTAKRFDDRTKDELVVVDALRDTLQRFADAKKHVIFMEDVPTIGFDPRSCIRRAGIATSQTRADCSISVADASKQYPNSLAIVEAVVKQVPGAELFRTWRYFCDDGHCQAIIKGRLMYRDTHHLSHDGDLYLGERFASEHASRQAQ